MGDDNHTGVLTNRVPAGARPAAPTAPGAAPRPATPADAVRWRSFMDQHADPERMPQPPSLPSLLDDPLRSRAVLVEDDQGALLAAGFARIQAHAGPLAGPVSAQRLVMQLLLPADLEDAASTGASVVQALVDWGGERRAAVAELELLASDARFLAECEKLGFVARPARVLLTRAIEPRAVERPEAVAALELPIESLAETGQARPIRWWLHAAVFAAGMTSVAFTDPWSGDPLRGGLLLLLDGAFAVYVFGFFAWLRYRKHTGGARGLS